MLKVKKIGYGCSADGQIVTLSFADERGKTSTIALDSDHVSNLYLRLEEAAEYAREKAVHSNKGFDPRILHPVHAKTVTGFGGAVADDGTPVLDLVLNGRLRLSVALKSTDLPALIEWLESFHETAQEAPPKLN